MVNIRIDQQMLTEELYRLRGLVSAEERDQALDRIDTIINLVANAPTDEVKSNFPKTKVRRW